MDVLRLDQIISLAVFLAALGVAWLMVMRHRDGLSARIGRGRRLRVVESAALGPSDRAMILNVDGQDFLLLRLKGGAPILRRLDAATVTEGQA
jgi:flagellar protein FliO/FliZ